MYNDSYIVENGWDQLYERSETISQPKDCGTCSGEGKEYFSKCCGAPVKEDDILHDNYCSDCLKVCDIDSEDCSTCNGEGETYE